MDAAITLLLVVAVICTVILAWTGRKRFPLRIGIGNFFRRKTQVAIVVTGLLIGTAIISSSFVISTTFDYTIKSEVYRTLDYVDEEVYTAGPDGRYVDFSYNDYSDLNANIPNMPHVSGMAPRYQLGASIIDGRSVLFESSGSVIGFDPVLELGSFARTDGSSWDGSGLGPTEVILNQQIADNIEARVGDPLAIYFGLSYPVPQFNVSVGEIVQNTGRGAWGGLPVVFMPLNVLQAAIGQPGRINLIVVANVGGPTTGYLDSDAASQELKQYLPATPAFTVFEIKYHSVDQATRNVSQLSQLFTLLGTFTIIAGVLLIVNIFVMLAEERKGEMGVARAVGMRRRNLVQSSVAEGLLYALLSAAVGSLVGLILAGGILWAFEAVYPARFLGGVKFVLTWTTADLVQAFTIGFLITMATIFLASWRVSKLNIVRAIRDIPEPIQRRSTRRQIGLGVALTILGVLGTFLAFAAGSTLLQDVGPVLMAIGLAVVVMRLISPRIAFTAAGVFIMIYLLFPYKPINMEGAGIDQFIVAGLLLVLGGLLIVLFNSDTVLAIITRVARRRTWRPVIRTAIAYPMNKKFRTGITLASIALVMFTIATMSGIESMVSSTIETTEARESGGFDIIAATNPAIPKPNWNGEFVNSSVSANISEYHGLSWVNFQFSKDVAFSGGLQNTTLYGMPTGWTNVPFDFQALDPAYQTGEEAWNAIRMNSDLAILDGSVAPQQFVSFNAMFGASVGDTLYFHNGANQTRQFRVIGILYERFVSGVFVGWDTVRTEFGVDYPSFFYFKVASGHDSTAVSHDLERTFIRYQMVTIDMNALIHDILQVVIGVFNLLEAYLALGLIVGIAGLGVITMRNVVERRTETGALRALGFRRSMVLRSYLFELSFIALTGILLGDILGIAISYDLYLSFFADQASFIIPWDKLLILSLAAFFGALIATASPAIRASRIPPAEALRTFE
jgi:putative ABC transport system permease protein